MQSQTSGCHRTERAAWINESVKALTLVVDKMNPIRSEVILDRDEIVYVHPNKERAEEYSHLPLEQCKRVYKDLVNQYKSLAKKIDEKIHWRELDNTANQLSAERKSTGENWITQPINYTLSVTN